jgi:hypothetical protein
MHEAPATFALEQQLQASQDARAALQNSLERGGSARPVGDVPQAAEAQLNRGVRSDRATADRGEGGSRRSGLMGAAAAMRSRLRRARSSRDA